eukprot:172884_1
MTNSCKYNSANRNFHTLNLLKTLISNDLKHRQIDSRTVNYLFNCVKRIRKESHKQIKMTVGLQQYNVVLMNVNPLLHNFMKTRRRFKSLIGSFKLILIKLA